MWDLEQEGRLWFSTEPEAQLVFTEGTITGPVTRGMTITGPRRIPRAAARPGRLVLWRGALRMLAAFPVLGVGPDNFRLLYGSYAGLAYADPRVHSNNMYLEIAAGTGMLGSIAAAWLGVRLAAHATRAAAQGDPLGPAIAAACAAVAVHGMADSFLSFTGTYILIAVTLGLASSCALDGGRDAHRV
jgi:O-antigen ligase